MIFDSFNNSLYQDLVDQAQENYSQNYWSFYSRGLCPVEESKKSLPYAQQLELFAEKVREADCVVVGGASRRWPHDSDVHPGAVLEPHAQLAQFVLHHREQEARDSPRAD